MAQKNDIKVVINNKVYTLSGQESEDYLQNVATYINGKIAECQSSEAYRRFNAEYQNVLLALNIMPMTTLRQRIRSIRCSPRMTTRISRYMI